MHCQVVVYRVSSKMAAQRFVLVLLCFKFTLRLTLARPHHTALASSQGQVVNPSVLGSLLTFSQRLSDMERSIKAHDKTIMKQEEMIQELKQAVKAKASTLDLQKVKTALQNNVAKIQENIRQRTMEIERYNNKLRTLEGAYSTTERDYASTRGKVEEIEDRFSRFSADCRRVRTGWKQRANGEIQFLDRHHVVCRSDEFLQSFVLNRRSDIERAMVRYVYRCCRLTL